MLLNASVFDQSVPFDQSRTHNVRAKGLIWRHYDTNLFLDAPNVENK